MLTFLRCLVILESEIVIEKLLPYLVLHGQMQRWLEFFPPTTLVAVRRFYDAIASELREREEKSPALFWMNDR